MQEDNTLIIRAVSSPKCFAKRIELLFFIENIKELQVKNDVLVGDVLDKKFYCWNKKIVKKTKKLKEKTLFECHIIRLKFNINKVIPEYFRFLSDTKYFRANIENRAKTSTMTTKSQEVITDIKIPVPPIQLQNQFADRLKIIEN